MLMLVCQAKMQVEMCSRLQPGAPFDRVVSWDDIEDRGALGWLREPTDIVAVTPWVDGSTPRRIDLLRSSLPIQRVLFIMKKDAENARRMMHSKIDEIAWLEQPTSELISAIRHLANPRYSRLLGEEIALVPDVPVRLRRALIFLCNAPRPITAVTELAHLTRCHRSTLLVDLRAALAPRMSLRLEDLLSWMLLLRALEIKADGVSWESAANQLDLYPNTLRRIAKRLTGRSLRELAVLGPDWLFRIVRDWVLTQFRGWPGA